MSLLLAAFFCATPGRAGTFGIQIAPFASSVAADFDGDRRTDVATAGLSRPDGVGYVLDITLRLSSIESGVIAVRTASPAGRISARDLDGDKDRDLILESFDREPLAVVLNDGGGRFHQGNLDEFRARLPKPGPISIEDAAWFSDSPDTGESLASPVAGPNLAGSEPDLARAAAARLRDELLVVLRHSNWSTRGPPASH